MQIRYVNNKYILEIYSIYVPRNNKIKIYENHIKPNDIQAIVFIIYVFNRDSKTFVRKLQNRVVVKTKGTIIIYGQLLKIIIVNENVNDMFTWSKINF